MSDLKSQDHNSRGPNLGSSDSPQSKMDAQLQSQVCNHVDVELQSCGIQFTEAMHASVMDAAKSRSELMRKLQQEKPSFWNREIRIPIPALMIPIVLIAVFGSMLLRMPSQLASGHNVSQVIQLPSGVFSSDELNQKS